MTIYAGSLKYSPIFKSHCCAFGRASEKRGFSVRYLFSREYKWMLSEETREKTTFVGRSITIPSMLRDAINPRERERIMRIFLEYHPTHFYMHNYHLMNHYIAQLCRIYGCSFIYHVHEPYMLEKEAHGGLHHYWLYMFEHLQKRLLEDTDIAVVSSHEASILFDFRYPSFLGKKVLIPLMYEDLANSFSNVEEREYVTFVGPPVPAKNARKFMEIVHFSSERNLGLKFLMISRDRVKEAQYFRERNLQVFCKERISDKEYGDLIKKSMVVLTPYKRETQSSVILVSYMYGTPVVSSNVGGLPEFVSNNRTGFLLDADASAGEWIDAITHVQENLATMSKNCRDYFVEKSSEKNWGKYLGELLV